MDKRNETSLHTSPQQSFVGARLVEMLLSRNAEKVLCFDITPPPPELLKRFTKESSGGASLVVFSGDDGNLTNRSSVQRAFQSEEKIDVVYHIAALVSPFHEYNAYMAVNYFRSMYILEEC